MLQPPPPQAADCCRLLGLAPKLGAELLLLRCSHRLHLDQLLLKLDAEPMLLRLHLAQLLLHLRGGPQVQGGGCL